MRGWSFLLQWSESGRGSCGRTTVRRNHQQQVSSMGVAPTCAQWFNLRRPLRCTFLTSTYKPRGARQVGGNTEGRGRRAELLLTASVLLKKRSSQKEESPSVHVCFRWSQQRPLLAPPSVGDSQQSGLTNHHCISEPSQQTKILCCLCPAPSQGRPRPLSACESPASLTGVRRLSCARRRPDTSCPSDPAHPRRESLSDT